MIILHLIPTLSGGGAERQLCYLASKLEDLGNEIHICYLNEGIEKPNLKGIILHPIKTRSNYSPYILWQLILIVRKTKPDIIHTWITQMDILGGILAFFFKIPTVIREPTSSLYYTNNWKNKLRISLGAKAKIIVSNSLGGDEYWKQRLPSSKRAIVRNGLPIEMIEKIGASLPIGLSNLTDPFVLYVGRLIESKSLNILLSAVALVKKKQDIKLVLCGVGNQKDELQELAERLNIVKDIYFAGYLMSEEIFALMKKASVFISLSDYEGCPNTVIEAMACGCPIIVSKIAAHLEILDDTTALFVENKDVNRIAEAMEDIFNNQEEANKRVNIAKNRTKEWSISEMAKKYESIYRSILN